MQESIILEIDLEWSKIREEKQLDFFQYIDDENIVLPNDQEVGDYWDSLDTNFRLEFNSFKYVKKDLSQPITNLNTANSKSNPNPIKKPEEPSKILHSSNQKNGIKTSRPVNIEKSREVFHEFIKNQYETSKKAERTHAFIQLHKQIILGLELISPENLEKVLSAYEILKNHFMGEDFYNPVNETYKVNNQEIEKNNLSLELMQDFGKRICQENSEISEKKIAAEIFLSMHYEELRISLEKLRESPSIKTSKTEREEYDKHIAVDFAHMQHRMQSRPILERLYTFSHLDEFNHLLKKEKITIGTVNQIIDLKENAGNNSFFWEIQSYEFFEKIAKGVLTDIGKFLVDNQLSVRKIKLFVENCFSHHNFPEKQTLSSKNKFSFEQLSITKNNYSSYEELLNKGFRLKGSSGSTVISGSTYPTNQEEVAEVLDSVYVGQLVDDRGAVCGIVGTLSDGCGHRDDPSENESIGRVAAEVCKIYAKSNHNPENKFVTENLIAREIKEIGKKSKNARLKSEHDATSTFTSAKILPDTSSETGYTAICTNLGDSHVIILDGKTGQIKYQMPAVQKKRYENHFTPQSVQNFDENDICINFYPVKPDDVVLLFSDGYSDELDTYSELSEDGNQRFTYIAENSISQLQCTKNLENISSHEIGLEFTQNISRKNYERREQIKILKENGIEDTANNAYLNHEAEIRDIIKSLKFIPAPERIEKLKKIQKRLSGKEGGFHKVSAESLNTYIAKLEKGENLATYEWNDIARAISSEFTIESFIEQLPDDLKQPFLNQLQEKGYSLNIPFLEFLSGLNEMLKPTGDDATLLVMKVPDIKIREQIRALMENPENAQIYLENLKKFSEEKIKKACEKLQAETKFEGEIKPSSVQENIKFVYSEDKIKEMLWIIKTYQESNGNTPENFRSLLDQKPEDVKLSFKGIVGLSKAFGIDLALQGEGTKALIYSLLKKEIDDNLNNKNQKLSLLEFAIKQPIWHESNKKKINAEILNLKNIERFDLLELWDDLTKTGCIDQPRIGDTKKIGELVAYFNFSKESYENLMKGLNLWLKDDFNKGFSGRYSGVYTFALIVKKHYLQKMIEESPCIENHLEQLLEDWTHSLETIKDHKEHFFSSQMKDFEEILNGKLSVAEKTVLILDLAFKYESDFGHNLYRFFSCIGSEERKKEKIAVKNFFDGIKDMNLPGYIDSIDLFQRPNLV